jgi:hypothetical protein
MEVREWLDGGCTETGADFPGKKTKEGAESICAIVYQFFHLRHGRRPRKKDETMSNPSQSQGVIPRFTRVGGSDLSRGAWWVKEGVG